MKTVLGTVGLFFGIPVLAGLVTGNFAWIVLAMAGCVVSAFVYERERNKTDDVKALVERIEKLESVKPVISSDDVKKMKEDVVKLSARVFGPNGKY